MRFDRNLLKKESERVLIPVGIVYGLIFALTFTWLLGTSEELNPLMQWEVRVIDYVIPFLNTIDFKWYAYSLNLLWAALILAPYRDYKCYVLISFFPIL